MAITIEVGGVLNWVARKSTTGKGWIAECYPMRLAIDADSLDDLHGMINETLQAVLSELVAEDALDQFLQERGWSKVPHHTPGKMDDVKFNVPWHLIAEGARGSDGHVGQ